jgi:CelD/BcsL family acetyltransferase involved in cellulose biosynthesis
MSRSPQFAQRVVALPALSTPDLEAWHKLRDTNPNYDSPYFHPGFAHAVQETGRDVSVVVLADSQGEVTALMPFHREGRRMRPLGSPGADFQGPIVAAGVTYDPRALLAPGAASFEFDHLLEVDDTFGPWVVSRRSSPYVDTEGGLDGYLSRASKSGRQNMSQARRRVAKAQRELGPLRFDADTVDEDLLDTVIELKRGQYAATGVRDYFADERRVALLRHLLHTRDTAFGGVLSGVYAGDRLLAAHFGIRAGGVLHWWFPVYDPDLSSLAPGWILLRELVMAAPDLGVMRIDLGRGEDNYKRWAKTGETIVCEGFLSANRVRVGAWRAKMRSIQAAKESAIGPKLREAARSWRTRGDDK